MRKFISLSLALLLIAGLFAACTSDGATDAPAADGPADTAGTDTPDAPEDGGADGETINLKWALWDIDLTVYYEPLLSAYKEINPGVNIEMVDLGSADYQTMVMTQLSGGADLDIITIKDIPGYNNLVRQNHLEPLNGFIASEGIDTSLYGGTVEQIMVEGETYQLPFRSDFWVIFYNKDLFDDAGVAYPSNDMTMDEYAALAAQLTTGSGADKVYGNHYHTWRSTVQLFGILDGQNTIVDGSYDFLKPTYEWYMAQQDAGVCMDFNTLNTTSTHYSGVFFNNQVAMVNMGSWFLATQIEKVKDGESLATNWGMVKYPHPDGVAAGTTLGTITGLAVNAKSGEAEKAAALDFLKFVTGPDGAEVVASTGTIPAIMNDEVIESIASIDGFPDDEGSKEAMRITQTYLEMPLHEKSADIEVILNEAHNNILSGNSTIDEGIAEMNERVGELLAG